MQHPDAPSSELNSAFAAGKKLNVLSFGDEADGDEDGDGGAFASGVRFRSAHETLAADEGASRLEAAAAGVHDAHVADLQARIAREQV